MSYTNVFGIKMGKPPTSANSSSWDECEIVAMGKPYVDSEKDDYDRCLYMIGETDVTEEEFRQRLLQSVGVTPVYIDTEI